jgi:glycosyltransferase involved in cell wall biosynthesis
MRSGIECSALVLNNRQLAAANEWITLDGLPVHRIHTPPRRRNALRDVFDPSLYRATLAELKRLKPDVVHVHNVLGATLAPFVACRAAGVPVVGTLHDYWLLCSSSSLYRQDGTSCASLSGCSGCGHCFRDYDVWADLPGRRRIFMLGTANARRFISPSQRLIDIHVQAGYRRARFDLVPYGLDEEIQSPKNAAIRAIIASAAEHNTVVFAGGGMRTKGVGVLLKALPAMIREVPRLRVVVVGGGEPVFLNQLRAYAPVVQVLHYVPFGEMRMLFASAQLSVSPSIWQDNSPVVIYENQQMGTPTVGTNAGGIPELIRDGETGYLFEMGDADGLAARVIGHFARPPESRRRMRFECAADAREKRSLAQHVKAVSAVYARAISAAASGGVA